MIGIELRGEIIDPIGVVKCNLVPKGRALVLVLADGEPVCLSKARGCNSRNCIPTQPAVFESSHNGRKTITPDLSTAR